MDINLTPFMKIACMGGAGHLWGWATRSDPRMTSLIWLVSEAAVQIFRSQTRLLDKNEENILLIVGALAATAYMAQRNLISDIFKACICVLIIAVASTALNKFFNEFYTNYRLNIGMRPLVDPTLIRF